MQILTQLQALGSRLDAMEKKSCKKSTVITKIKNKSTKPKIKSQTAVTPPPVHQNSGFTDLQRLRQDVNLQIQVEKRLQELASLNKAGTKVKCPTRLNGPMSTFSQETLKNESHAISCLLHNGWLALVAS